MIARQECVAMVLGGPTTVLDVGGLRIVPARYDGWARFSEGRDDLARAFDDAGLAARLRLTGHGTWIPRASRRAGTALPCRQRLPGRRCVVGKSL